MLPRIGLDRRAARSPIRTRGALLKLMAPAVLAVSVAQISLIINTHIASRLAAGSVSWISYADRLMEFPTALLGVALGTVLLPSLSRATRDGDERRVQRACSTGACGWCVLLALPCMVGLALMAEPLTALLFHYGRFGAHDVEMTRLAVIGYAVGLLGLIAIKVLAPGFYAQQDVRTPVRIALAGAGRHPAAEPRHSSRGSRTQAWRCRSRSGRCVNAALLLAGLWRRGVYRPRPGWAGARSRRCSRPRGDGAAARGDGVGASTGSRCAQHAVAADRPRARPGRRRPADLPGQRCCWPAFARASSCCAAASD